MPTIAAMNESSVWSDTQVQAILPALHAQWNQALVPIWRVEPMSFLWVPKGGKPPASAWWLTFLDDSDQAGALAYHDVTSNGLPLAKVFVKTLLSDGASVSVGASHELVEMACDPILSEACQDSTGTFWAKEIADPTEADQYAFSFNGVLVSDFVTPACFGYQSSHGPYDWLRHLTAPFQIASGGYAQQFVNGQWTMVNGAESTKTIRPGSRLERRTRLERIRSAER